jgi:uncharacterized protein YndB with AHSA1/START domain
VEAIMDTHVTQHCTFSIKRSLSAPPSEVFNAWANPEIKGRWFKGPGEWSNLGYELDFRIGGHEHMASGPSEGPMHVYDATIEDIVPNERIVYSYEMHLDKKRISVSLATVELEPEGDDGTRLIFTEQDVFLDAADNETARVEGTRELLENLESELRRERHLV